MLTPEGQASYLKLYSVHPDTTSDLLNSIRGYLVDEWGAAHISFRDNSQSAMIVHWTATEGTLADIGLEEDWAKYQSAPR